MFDDESLSLAKCAGLEGPNATDGNQLVRFVRATRFNAPMPVQVLHLLRGNACPDWYRESLLKVGCLAGAMKKSLQ